MPDVGSLVKGQSQKLRSKFRKAITGDEKTRIRDHVQEQPDYVKLFDKVAFTLGLLNILACEYILLKLPTYFWLWYSLVIPMLVLTRIYHFKSLGWQYFLLDFCYFVHLCIFLNLYFINNSQLFFKVCFIYANGPLTLGIVIWRNSLVFHDYDKITSVYIHILPCILYYASRWDGCDSLFQSKSTLFQSCKIQEGITSHSPHGNKIQEGITSHSPHGNLSLHDFFVAALGYLFWQICYFAKTEIMDKRKLDSRPDLVTSLRWMSSDKKNFFAKQALILSRKVGLLGREEHFNAYSYKTKFIFMFAQLVVTIFTFLPTIFVYNYQHLHIIFVLFIFCNAAFNGASFYIEVFSKVYQLKIEKLQLIKMTKLNMDSDSPPGFQLPNEYNNEKDNDNHDHANYDNDNNDDNGYSPNYPQDYLPNTHDSHGLLPDSNENNDDNYNNKKNDNNDNSEIYSPEHYDTDENDNNLENDLRNDLDNDVYRSNKEKKKEIYGAHRVKYVRTNGDGVAEGENDINSSIGGSDKSNDKTNSTSNNKSPKNIAKYIEITREDFEKRSRENTPVKSCSPNDSDTKYIDMNEDMRDRSISLC